MAESTEAPMGNDSLFGRYCEIPTGSFDDYDFEAFQNAELADRMLAWELSQNCQPQQPSVSGPGGDSHAVDSNNAFFPLHPFSPVISQEQTYFAEAMPQALPPSYEELRGKLTEAEQRINELDREIAALRARMEPEVQVKTEDFAFETTKVRNPKPEKKQPKNARPQNILAFQPKDYYSQLPMLTPWATAKGTCIHYTADGELDPLIKFTPPELFDFLDNHPMHGRHRGYFPKQAGSGLTIWIQNTPADAVKRYPYAASSKCRFANCPVPGNTIRKGEFRVCFDEWNSWMHEDYPNISKDPYHNAGYVHLYCLEKELDFASLCKNFNVQGDSRRFVEERNKMAITRDCESMLRIVNEFRMNSVPRNGQRTDDWYDSSLSLALTREHLAREPRKRQAVREKRDGNSIDRHLNNLDVMVQGAEEIRQRKTKLSGVKQEDEDDQKPMISPIVRRKRNAREMDDESGLPSQWGEQDRLLKRSRRSIALRY